VGLHNGDKTVPSWSSQPISAGTRDFFPALPYGSMGCNYGRGGITRECNPDRNAPETSSAISWIQFGQRIAKHKSTAWVQFGMANAASASSEDDRSRNLPEGWESKTSAIGETDWPPLGNFMSGRCNCGPRRLQSLYDVKILPPVTIRVHDSNWLSTIEDA